MRCVRYLKLSQQQETKTIQLVDINIVTFRVAELRIHLSVCKDERLSDASKMTLEHQGGPMTEQEVLEFSTHPLRDLVIKMRTWDEKAKDTNMYSNAEEVEAGLRDIETRLDEYLSMQN